MPKIVQFTHPGQEHKPDKRRGSITSWNKGNHKRKFMKAYGSFMDEKGLGESKMTFWGEWEPPSYVQLLDQITEEHPKYLHTPFLPNELPTPNEDSPYQNTDPFVFDEHFRYFICKQFKTKNEQLTSLATLDEGSIILFGSTKGKTSNESRFLLDTVFVVGERKPYHSSMNSFPFTDNNSEYEKLTLNMVHHKISELDLELSLYLGASPKNPIHGMYSFSPSLKIDENIAYGFPRLSLRNIKYITNNLNSAPKISSVTTEEAQKFFNEIVNISRENGLVEGFNFIYSTQKQN